MLVDLHAHFPMHLLADDEQRTHERGQTWGRQRWEGEVVDLISHFANYQGRGDSPSVTEQLMRTGNVGVALSVLYEPFDEMDLTQSYGAPPREGYFQDIVDQHQTVEDYAAAHPGDVAIAHSPAELDALLTGDAPVLIHAVEGGFQIGAEPVEVRANAARLAELGIAYVTVAHLFFRDVATNAPALPFLPDWVYNRVFHQAHGEGLTELGRELVNALIDVGILVDITHMRSESISDVFELLDQRDPAHEIPVIATHMAYRFGDLQYSFDDATVIAVAQRGGLLGCILCQHYIQSGLPKADSFTTSVNDLCRHIDRIHDLTGGFDSIAIGSDLDGYIKPALPGLEHMGHMAALQAALADRYGESDAEKLCSANALRVLRAHWGRKRPRAEQVQDDTAGG
jgi:microsomal dipeptidase-like Zn-dependent dipeptidase